MNVEMLVRMVALKIPKYFKNGLHSRTTLFEKYEKQYDFLIEKHID